MLKKNIIRIILVVSILFNLVLCVYSYNKTKELNSSLKTITNLKEDEQKQKLPLEVSNIDIGDETKIKIATKLFQEYIHINETNWKYNQERDIKDSNKLTFEDFKIKNVSVVSTDKNKFTVDIIYDIKKSVDSCSNIWNAGTGIDGNDNWILDKSNLVDIIKYQDKYYIESVYN